MRNLLLVLLIATAGCIGELNAPTPSPPVPPIATDPGGMPPATDPGNLPPGSTPIPPVVDPTTPPGATTPPAPTTMPPATTPPATTPPATTPPVSPPPSGACAVQRPIPADAEAVLEARCLSCHASRPLPGVQGSLTSPDDFMRPSKLDPNRTVGQLVLARIADRSMPPAPGAPLTAGEKASLESWIGALQASCPTTPPVVAPPGAGPSTTPPPVVTPPPGPSIFDVPARCTSGTFYRPRRGGGGDDDNLIEKGGDDGKGGGGGEGGGGEGGGGEGDGGSPLMNPGRACISCHATNEAPRFEAAGTIYPSAHEPNDCNGVAGNAAAVIVDASGKTVTVRANAAGNFFVPASENLQPPLRAKVTFNGRERIMLRTIPNGDCNACHTQTGTQMAPGRIVLP